MKVSLTHTYLLSSEEDENVSFHLLTDVYLNHSSNGCLQIVPLRLRGEEDLHRVSTTRDTLREQRDIATGYFDKISTSGDAQILFSSKDITVDIQCPRNPTNKLLCFV